MDWGRPYTATWRIFKVNRRTWADGELVTGVDKASVSRTADGDLLETGSLDVTGDFETDYYRIVMTANQGGEVERVDVATLLFEVEKGKTNYGTTSHSVDGHSVLYPASTTSIVTGAYAPKGVDGAQYAKNLLEGAINAPVEAEGSFILDDHVVHELGAPVLEAVWDVLTAGGFVIQIDGRGVVHIRPKPVEPSLVIDSLTSDIVFPGIDYDKDLSGIPNRYVVIVDNNITIAENNDPESVISTVNRGYCVDQVDTSPILVNGETLGRYANRKLKEASVVKENKNYKREYAPDVYLYSIVKATIDGLEGDLRVESQSIECGNGITLSEKASREIILWQ